MDDVSGADTAAPVAAGSIRRGSAREALIASATELLIGATLDDLTAFITAARLSRDSGTSTGAIYSAFEPEPGVGGATRSAPQAAARQAFLEPSFDTDLVVATGRAILADAITEGRQGRTGVDVTVVAEALAELSREGAAGSLAANYTQLFLAAAVAVNDPEIRESAAMEYREIRQAYEPMVAQMLALSEREPVEGISVARLTELMVAAVDGAVVPVRFDPSFGAELATLAVLGLWAGLTRSAGDVDDLLERRVASHLVHPLSVEDQARIAQAVRRLQERAGWGAVTLRKVAQLSGVPVVRLAARYPHRDDLAPIVWSELAAGVSRRAAVQDGRPAVRAVAVVHDVAEAACSNRALTGSLLRACLSEPDPMADRVCPHAVLDTLIEAFGPDQHRLGACRAAVDALLVGATRPESRAEDLARSVLADLVAP